MKTEKEMLEDISYKLTEIKWMLLVVGLYVAIQVVLK